MYSDDQDLFIYVQQHLHCWDKTYKTWLRKCAEQQSEYQHKLM